MKLFEIVFQDGTSIIQFGESREAIFAKFHKVKQVFEVVIH